MKTDYETILSRTRGTLDRLFSLTVHQTMDRTARRNVDRWMIQYLSDGLPVAKSKDEADTARAMVADGFFQGQGKTKGAAYSLTFKAIVSTCAAEEVSGNDLRKTLQRVADLQAASNFSVPGAGFKIAMGFDVCPTAGQWWGCRNDDAAWEAYLNEFHAIDETLLPLLTLGWITRYASLSGIQWGLGMTPSGHEALKNWPDVKPVPMESDYEAWESGWKSALPIFTNGTPPPGTRAILWRMLPDTQWIGGA